MKTFTKAIAIILTSLLFFGCIKNEIASEPISKDAMQASIKVTGKEALKQFSFFVFPEPQALPEITAKAMKGADLSLNDFKEKITLLNFWASWCGPCLKEMPAMEALYTELKDEGFNIIAINAENDKKGIDKILKENAYTFPIYYDETQRLAPNFVPRGFPTSYLIDKKGNAIAMVQGAFHYDDPDFIEVIRELAKDE